MFLLYHLLEEEETRGSVNVLDEHLFVGNNCVSGETTALGAVDEVDERWLSELVPDGDDGL